MGYIYKTYSKTNLSRNILSETLDLIQKLPWMKRSVWITKKIKSIWIAYDNMVPIWIACIKIPTKTHILSLQKKSGINDIPQKELWYCFVKPAYRWQWIIKNILKKLLKDTAPIFVTTAKKNEAMQRILTHHNFQQSWIPFASELGKYKIILFIKFDKNH